MFSTRYGCAIPQWVIDQTVKFSGEIQGLHDLLFKNKDYNMSKKGVDTFV